MKPVRKAQNILLELGVRAMASGETEWAAVKVLSLMRLDPVGAGQALIGLSKVLRPIWRRARRAPRQLERCGFRFDPPPKIIG
jgi:hypothetical protein